MNIREQLFIARRILSYCLDMVQSIMLVEKYTDLILRIALHNLKNTSDAEDVIQEVFIKLLEKKDFNDEEHVKSWLIRVTINLCKDFNKSAWRKKTVTLDKIIEPVPTVSINLMNELRRLPFKFQRVLYLHYYEGYTIKEIAILLNVNVNTVQSWLNRGRKKMKQIIIEGGVFNE